MDNTKTGRSMGVALAALIEQFVLRSPENGLPAIDGGPIWDAPLVGFADGDDPLFELYRQVVGPFHLTPREALLEAGYELPLDAPVSVISWVLPAAEATRASNREMTVGASQRWQHSRFTGEAFNDTLRRAVVDHLHAHGYAAAAPALAPDFASQRGPYGWASTWSERHMAYAAGLGTFSLSDGLITERGIAHRVGSVVSALRLPATPRPYSGPYDYCLFHVDGGCGRCIERCPAGALSTVGHDKERCREYLMVQLTEWARQPGYIGPYGACGLCQTGVPCEDCRP